MPDVRLGVLGSMEVRVDGEPVVVPPGRRRGALARLIMHRGRPVPVDDLVDAVWGESAPGDPVGALRTVVSRLRGCIGDVIRFDDGLGYRLDLPAASVDVGRFEELLARAEVAGAPRARELLEEALALWRGRPYEDVADAPFALVEVMRLEGLRSGAEERLATLAVEAGDTGAGIALAEGLLEREPFREGAVEALVTALYRSGRQVDALDECRRYRERLVEELGLDPGPSLARLEERVLGHDLPTSAPPPAWLDTSSAFIGREEELADLVAAVAGDRLTVVTGPGGVGKSRLVAEALPALHARTGLPVAVTELAGVTDGGAAVAVATSLGLRPTTPGAAPGMLVEHLAASPHLLVVDNCEHLLDEVSRLLAPLAARCRDLRVVATSRHRFGSASERVLPLLPLEVPDPGDGTGLRGAASVRLLTDRVRRISPGFAVTPESAAAVGALCRRADGLPLALELAASRVAGRGVAGVLGPLSGAAAAKGETALEQVVAWSHRLLTPQQQELLADLSVFAGGFTGEDVRGLEALLPDRGVDLLADLAELAESALVVAEVDGAAVRYRLLVLVRAFAAERLREAGRADAVAGAHATHVAEVTEAVARDWPYEEGARVDARLRQVSPEAVTAIRWALAAGRLDLAARIAAAIAGCLHWTPGVEVTDLFPQVAEAGVAAPAPDLAAGVGAGAFVAAERGDLAGADRLARAALRMAGDETPTLPLLALAVAAIYRGDRAEAERWFGHLARRPHLVADAHASLALGACYHRDLRAAREHVRTALAAGASAPDASLAFARFAAGEVALVEDPEVGVVHLRRAAGDARRVGAEQVERVARVALLAALTRGGHLDEAVELAPRLVADLRTKGVWVQLWTVLRVSAELLAACARPAEAAFVLEASLADTAAPPLVGDDLERYDALATSLTSTLSPAAVSGIRSLAAASPRGVVAERAEAALRALDPRPDPLDGTARAGKPRHGRETPR